MTTVPANPPGSTPAATAETTVDDSGSTIVILPDATSANNVESAQNTQDQSLPTNTGSTDDDDDDNDDDDSGSPTTVPLTTTNAAGSIVETLVGVSSTRQATEPIGQTATNDAGETEATAPPANTAPTATSGGNENNNNNDNDEDDNDNDEGDEATPAVSTPPATQTGFLVPVVITTTNEDGEEVEFTTSAFQNTAPASVQVPITTTDESGATITTNSFVAAAVVTAENGDVSTSPLASVQVASGGRIVTSDAAPGASEPTSSPAPTAGPSNPAANGGGRDITTTDADGNPITLTDAERGDVFTFTNARGSTFVTTYTGGAGGVVSELVVQTITAGDGSRSTITSFAVVGGVVTAAAENGRAQSGPTEQGDPSLQNSAPSGFGGMGVWVAVAAGVAGLAVGL